MAEVNCNGSQDDKYDVEPDEKELVWEPVKVEHIVRDEWIDFRRIAYRFPDGSVFEPFYNYSRRSYVVIAASDEKGRFICVRQFRHGIGCVTTEFPAGGIETADGIEYGNNYSEDIIDAGKRELLEETGYVSDEWSGLLTIPSNATLADNYAYILRAKNCRKVDGQHLDTTEFLNFRLHTHEEIEELIHAGKFQQAIHVLAFLLADRADG